MSMIWWFVPWLQPDEPGLERLGQHCRFTNNEEMVRARSGSQTFSPINFPTARLELTLEKFSLDCFFWQSYVLVSQNLRDAMAQEPWEVQYFPVDSSLSAQLPRSKNYMIMRVPVVENVSGRSRLGRSTASETHRHQERFRTETRNVSRPLLLKSCILHRRIRSQDIARAMQRNALCRSRAYGQDNAFSQSPRDRGGERRTRPRGIAYKVGSGDR
jgi:hypothetical protein